MRKGREEQAAQLNFDPKTILADARKRQKDSSHRLVLICLQAEESQVSVSAAGADFAGKRGRNVGG